MNEQMAFSYRECDTCVALAKRVLKRKRQMSWSELETLLFLHQSSHPPRVHQLNIYPSMASIPGTDKLELTGILFLKIPDCYFSIRNVIRAQVHLYAPISYRWLKGYIADNFEDYELNLELRIARDIIYAGLELEDMDMETMFKFLAIQSS